MTPTFVPDLGAIKDLPSHIWEQLLRTLCTLCSAVLGPVQLLAASCPTWLGLIALDNIAPADELAGNDGHLLLGLCLGIHACSLLADAAHLYQHQKQSQRAWCI